MIHSFNTGRHYSPQGQHITLYCIFGDSIRNEDSPDATRALAIYFRDNTRGIGGVVCLEVPYYGTSMGLIERLFMAEYDAGRYNQV